MRILVTGAAGFIGSHYVRTLLSGGYPGYEDAEVTVLDKLTYAGNLANLDPVAGRFSFTRGDICDAQLLADLVPGHDAVINFAAESHVDRSIAGAGDFVTANVVGVQVLLDACRTAGVRKVVQVSTDEVYGSIASGSWTEESPLDPNSPYSAAKAGGDLLALAFARTHGLDVSITRCCNNYGPYQYPEKVIPLFATNLLDGKPVPLYGDGANVRGWIHVDDHCRGIQLVLEQGAAIRARDVHTVVRLAGILRGEMGRRQLLEEERSRLLARSGERLGVPAEAVTLGLLSTLMDDASAESAHARSAELRGLLHELQREHTCNRSLMQIELGFLDHLMGILSLDGVNGYDTHGSSTSITRSRPHGI